MTCQQPFGFLSKEGANSSPIGEDKGRFFLYQKTLSHSKEFFNFFNYEIYMIYTKKETRIPLHNILESMYGIGKINSKEKLQELIAALEEDVRINGDKEIDFQKFVKDVKKS